MGHQPSLSPILAVIVSLVLVMGATETAGAETRLSLDHSFELIDANGKPVTATSFPGRWLLLYFGYTRCADQCPTALSAVVEALDQIGPAADHIQPLFVTVDPERDGGPMLQAFVASFDKRLVGLTGTSRQIADAASLFGIEYSKVLAGSDDYVIDHSAKLTLVAPNRHDAVSFAFAEPYLIAAKLIDELSRAGIALDTVNNLRAFH
jgi:protein SCO1/2